MPETPRHSQDWYDGYHAGKAGCVFAEDVPADYLVGWMVGHRDRQNDELIDQIEADLGLVNEQ